MWFCGWRDEMILVAVLGVAELLVGPSMSDQGRVITQKKMETLLLQFEVKRVAKHKTINAFPVEMLLRRG